MDYKLVAAKKEQIKKLYFDYCKISIETAIKMGELLAEIKEQVGHGNFDNWVKDNMPFSRMSANNYVRVYKYSLTSEGKITLQKVGLDVTDIYKLLIEHKPNPPALIKDQPKPESKVEVMAQEQAPKPQSMVFEKAEVKEKTIDEQLCEGLEIQDDCFWLRLTDKNMEKALEVTKKLLETRIPIYTITQWVNDLIENYEEKIV
jgi:hypothetical protein